MRISGHLFGIVLMAIFLCACGKEKKGTMVFENIVISAEGPLFGGANTAQGEVLNMLNAYAKVNGIEISGIRSARLKKFTLVINDSTDFDLFSSMNVQFVSDKTDMIAAASVNKVKPGSKKLDLTISGDQKGLLELLKQDKFTVVADAITTKDSNTNITLIGNMEVELDY